MGSPKRASAHVKAILSGQAREQSQAHVHKCHAARTFAPARPSVERDS